MATSADSYVTLRLPGGELQTVGPGSLLGRSFAADVRLDDGRISEAHAFLSLRGGQFVLFALRGRLRVHGRDVMRVDVTPGQQLELARGVVLEVTGVVAPRHTLALRGPGLEEQVLVEVCSLYLEPVAHLVPGHHSDAAAVLFSDGLMWTLRTADGAQREVTAGETVQIGAYPLEFSDRWLAAAEVAETAPLVPGGAVRLVSYFDSVHLLDDSGAAICVLTGLPARMMAELLAYGGPVDWRSLARGLWGAGEADLVLRNRLDVTLAKLRRLLRAAGVQRELVVAHRTGLIELILYPGDKIEDRA